MAGAALRDAAVASVLPCAPHRSEEPRFEQVFTQKRYACNYSRHHEGREQGPMGTENRDPGVALGAREDFPDEVGTCGMTRNSPDGEPGQAFQAAGRACSAVCSVS